MRIGVEASALTNQAGTGVLLRHALAQLHARGHEVVEFHHGYAGTASVIGRPSVARRLVNGLRQMWWMQRTLPALARRAGVKVLLCPAYVGPLRSVVPVVVMILDLTFLLEPQTGDRLYMRYLRMTVPPLVRRARRVVTISHSAAAEIARLLPAAAGKIDVAYPGPGQDSRLDVEAPGRRLTDVLMVGTLEPRKNYPRALEAFRLLRATIPDVTLRIAGGGGWGGSDLAAAVSRLGLDGAVTFLGRVPEQRLGSLYREAAALFYPSLYEGFGFPILEAMSAGCPVVTSNRSSMAEIAGDAAELVDPLDAPDMARGLRAVVAPESAPRREALINRGYGRAAEFSWDRFGASLEQSLLAGATPA